MVDAATTRQKDPLLSQGAHEIRNPTAVIIGYSRMLMGDKMGSLNDRQRKLLNEILTSAAKLTALADEMTLLGQLHVGSIKFDKTRLELAPLILEQIPSVPAVPDRDTTIRLIDRAPGAKIEGDKNHLRKTLQSLLFAHRRELILSDELCVALDRMTHQGRPAIRMTIAGADLIDELTGLPLGAMSPFLEFRGGIGYTLSIAREVVVAHGGEIVSRTRPREDPGHTPFIDGAAVVFPEA